MIKGTKYGPSYGNLVMFYLVGRFYDEVGKTFDHNFKGTL